MAQMTATQLQSYYDQTPNARRMALVSVGLVMVVCSLVLSAVNIAIPRIAFDLRASAIAVSWIPVAMLWGNVVFLLPIGRLCRHRGAKTHFCHWHNTIYLVFFVRTAATIYYPFATYPSGTRHF